MERLKTTIIKLEYSGLKRSIRTASTDERNEIHTTVQLQENGDLKSEPCCCCLELVGAKRLWCPYTCASGTEVYGEMLQECYNLNLHRGEMTSEQICEVCVARLRSAALFKRQVLNCQRELAKLAPEIKTEFEESTEDDLPIPYDITQIKTEEEIKFSDDDSDSGIKHDEIEIPIPEPVVINKHINKKHKKKIKDCRKQSQLKLDKYDEKTTESISRPKRKPKKLIRIQNNNQLKPVSKNKIVDYVCPQCNFKFKSKRNLTRHIDNIHLKQIRNDRPKCPHCKTRFQTLVAFFKHKLEAHNVDDRLQCNACGKMYYEEKALKAHIEVYHMMGEKKKCQLCDFETYGRRSMKIHMDKHKKVKDKHCKYCEKSFLRDRTLKLHEKIHTGDKKKVCKECGKAFVQKASLNYHMAKYHPEVPF